MISTCSVVDLLAEFVDAQTKRYNQDPPHPRSPVALRFTHQVISGLVETNRIPVKNHQLTIVDHDHGPFNFLVCRVRDTSTSNWSTIRGGRTRGVASTVEVRERLKLPLPFRSSSRYEPSFRSRVALPPCAAYFLDLLAFFRLRSWPAVCSFHFVC